MITIQQGSAASSTDTTPVQIDTRTPSGVASSDLTNLSQSYTDIIIHFSGVSFAAARKFMIKPSIGGVFGGTNIHKKIIDGTTVAQFNNAISFMSNNATMVPGAASGANSGILHIKNYSNTSMFKPFTLHIWQDGTTTVQLVEGVFFSTSAIDGFRFYATAYGGDVETESASNFDAGTITTYGVP